MQLICVKDAAAGVSYTLRRIFRDVQNWVACRTYRRYHVLRLGTDPGFSDSREMLLNANFAVLVHYVEHELAERQKYSCKYKKIPYRHRSNEQLGLECLQLWLDMPCEVYGGIDVNESTRVFAQEVKYLYLWWTSERKLRHNPYDDMTERLRQEVTSDGRDWFVFVPIDDEPGLSTIKYNLTEDEEQRLHDARAKSSELEARWDDEDQAMLHRLIDIRFHLWT